ncbi:MAG: ABC transporter substrate-binding protein [Chloroflexota bacterium]
MVNRRYQNVVGRPLVRLGSLLVAGVLVLSACAPSAAPAQPPAADQPRATQSSPQTVPSPSARTPSTASLTPAPTPTRAAASPPAATGQPKYGGMLTIRNPDPPSTFDMHQGARIDVSIPFSNVYIGLLRKDPLDTEKGIPSMAKEWQISPNGTEYTFTLNPGIKWHDGRALTAEDVAWNLNRMAFPPKGVAAPRTVGLLVGMVKAEAVDATKVRITLDAPSGSFLDRLANDWIVMLPRHILEKKQGDDLDVVVGTGSFKFARYNTNISIELTKNKDYFVPTRPYLDGITIFIIPDDRTGFAALRTGRVLLTTVGSRAISPTEAELIETDADLSKKIMVERYASPTKMGFMPNVESKPWDDVRLRRAVSLALDRQAAVKVAQNAVIGGYLNPRTPWGIPPEEVLKRPGYRQPKDQDIAAAKRLMAEAGYANGLDVSLLCRQGFDCERLASLVSADMAKIGIRATLVPTAANVLTEQFIKGRFSAAHYSVSSPTSDPDSALTPYLTGDGRNYPRFSDAQVDAWFKEQARTLDQTKRQEIVRRIEERLLDLEPHSTLYFIDYLRGRWNIVKGFKSGPYLQDENLEYAWLDK